MRRSWSKSCAVLRSSMRAVFRRDGREGGGEDHRRICERGSSSLAERWPGGNARLVSVRRPERAQRTHCHPERAQRVEGSAPTNHCAGGSRGGRGGCDTEDAEDYSRGGAPRTGSPAYPSTAKNL